MVGGITCVSSPINELVTKIQRAQSGIDTPTDAICMDGGARILPNALKNKVTNLGSVTFDCYQDAAVCTSGGPITTSGDTLEASQNVKFKGIIHCDGPQSNGDYDCTISIKSA